MLAKLTKTTGITKTYLLFQEAALNTETDPHRFRISNRRNISV